MKINVLLGGLVVAGFPFLSSCDKDEKPKPAGVTFELDKIQVNESDGTLTSLHPLIYSDGEGREIEVKILLDKPAAETAVISYSVSGSATKSSSASLGDYSIDGNNLIIDKGATEAILNVVLFEDLEFEVEEFDEDELPIETIVITLESVISGPVVIGEQSEHTITVYEDDLYIALDWEDNLATHDADLDLIAWYKKPSDGTWAVANSSTNAGTDGEALFIPAGFYNTNYAMSYIYYSGTSNDVDLEATFINLGGSLNSGASGQSFTGNLGLDNINVYDDENSPKYKGDPIHVQTMVKSNLNYTGLTNITKPSSGSRMDIGTMKVDLKSLKGKKPVAFDILSKLKK